MGAGAAPAVPALAAPPHLPAARGGLQVPGTSIANPNPPNKLAYQLLFDVLFPLAAALPISALVLPAPASRKVSPATWRALERACRPGRQQASRMESGRCASTPPACLPACLPAGPRRVLPGGARPGPAVRWGG